MTGLSGGGLKKKIWHDNIRKCIVNLIGSRIFDVQFKNKILSNLSIFITPDEKCWPNIIGDILIRLVGVSKRTSTYVYAKRFIKDVPVVSITFSSTTPDDKLSDVVITRYESNVTNKIHYITPVIQPISHVVDINMTIKKNLLTVLSQDRIFSALSRFSISDWRDVCDFFEDNPEFNWELIGSNNISEVECLIANSVDAKYCSRFKVSAFSELNKQFENSFAYLCFENFYGGGGAANFAFAYSVPVIACKNWKSDVSNHTPIETLSINFKECLNLISKLSRNNNDYMNLLKVQNDFYSERTNLEAKGNELFVKLQSVFFR